jgi:RNA polymerase sigma-70 factor, ECF subfamily
MVQSSLSQHTSQDKRIRKKNQLSNARQYAFEYMITPLLKSLYGTALRMTQNKQKAEDLVRNTLIKAIRDFDQSQKKIPFKTLIFSILINEYITTYKKKTPPATEEWKQDLEEFYLYGKIDITLHPQDSNKADFLDFFTEEDVKNALENVPGQFRLPIILSDIEEFSIGEIAGIINLSSRTVISRLSQGRKLLQRSLWSHVTMK